MSIRKSLLISGVAALALAAVGLAQNDADNSYSTVTDERLTNPEPENWLQYRNTYDGWGYSSLDSINVDNVDQLQPVWSFATGMLSGHQSPPVVNDGVMFTTTPNGHVIALDAATGDQIWRHRRKLAEGAHGHETNRGVALYGDMVYFGSNDAYLTALDARTGEVAWSNQVADATEGYYITLAPLTAKGVVMVGVSGGEYGVRGFIEAFDAESGDSVWKTYTVPGPGEEGNDTWPGDTWKTGGAAVWITGTYDSDTGLSYWGTGNGGPWLGPATRLGDNLYATSTVVVDVESGELVSHFQYQPNDTWDWDEVSAPVLIDVERDGTSFPAAVHASRSGYLYLLDRSDGGLEFVDAQEYVYNDVITGFDEDGRPS